MTVLVVSVTFSLSLLTALRGEDEKAQSSDDPKQEELERASHNPYLWAHFGGISWEGSIPGDRFGDRPTVVEPRTVREHETQLRIEAFLKKVRNQSEQLAACGKALLDWDQKDSTPGELDQLLRRTEESARDLRSTLVFVYYPIAESGGMKDVAVDEVGLTQLGLSIFDVYRRVYGSVFGKDATVSVDQLRHGDMLASLSSVQKMAKQLRR